MIKLSDIKANPNNPRVVRDERFAKLCKSIQEFPKMMSLRPIVVDANSVVLGGNMRLRALQHLKYKEVPDDWIRCADDLTEDEQKRFIIADNVGFGEWDWSTLANEWEAEELEDWGLEIPNFDTEEEAEAQEDNYQMPDNIQVDVVLGDLIEIGPHRLLCGDSTDSDAVARLIDGANVDMLFTDPPYEIDFDYFTCLVFCKNAHIFIFNNDRALIRQLNESPFEFKKFFVFHHGGTAIPQEGGNEAFLDHILISHETVGTPIKYNKGGGTRTVLKGEYRRAEEHKHEKPVSVLSPIIEAYTNAGFVIVDLFAGGGSLFSVAHQLNRKCYGMEIDPKYCQVIIDRMVKLDPDLTVLINGKPYFKTAEKQPK